VNVNTTNVVENAVNRAPLFKEQKVTRQLLAPMDQVRKPRLLLGSTRRRC
jgi:hypothetical protein